MRSIVQRVKRANVKVQGAEAGSISSGLLVFLGLGKMIPWLILIGWLKTYRFKNI